MSALLERLRDALVADYTVDRELASGGMGVIFLGRDVALDRPVAIKIIRPDLATANAAERFLREARVLASLHHPNIVPIHRAGEAGGFFYYVMDYLEAETLADRLAHARLSPQQAIRLGRDLLLALEEVHKRGVVHRDIKPGNIFLGERGAILGDFGIAKPTADAGADITAGSRALGTPGYMAPEQMAGAEVGPATDICTLGLVLYEALTGRGWGFPARTERPDWSGVPRKIARVLERAVAWEARDRWPDVATFRRALERAGTRARLGRRRGLSVLGLGAVAVAAVLITRSPGAKALRIDIAPFGVRGWAEARWLGDSLASSLAHRLGANPEFAVRFAGADGTGGARPALVLGGTAEVRGDTLRVEVRPEVTSGEVRRVYAAVRGPVAGWSELADSLAFQIVLELWRAEDSPLLADLPTKALPRSTLGLVAWAEAERLFSRAQWGAADTAYRRAAELDPGCLICDVRLNLIARWMRQPQDSARARRYVAAVESFPTHYRMLFEASVSPRRQRWDKLREATDRARTFYMAWFIRGDEHLHRGPLEGYRRKEALGYLRHAADLRPGFAPVWEHLASAAIAEGDSATARRALGQYVRYAAEEDLWSQEIRVLNELGFAWRFGPAEAAAGITRALLADPDIARFPDLAAALAYLLPFDAPQGVVWVGEQFARGNPLQDLEVPGFLGQVLGLLALGMPDSARAVARVLRTRSADPEVDLFTAELDAVVLFLDPDDIARSWPSVRHELEAYADNAAALAHHRRRAAWKLALLARRAGAVAEARRYRAALNAEPPPRPFATLLDADWLAGQGRWAAAVRASDTLLALDSGSTSQVGDPFFRALLHLLRAEWHAGRQQPDRAVRDLRWHENTDFVGYARSSVQAVEVDWALGTVARWRRARGLDRVGGGPELCRAYADVVRLWADGEPRFRARADSADARFRALGCARPR